MNLFFPVEIRHQETNHLFFQHYQVIFLRAPLKHPLNIIYPGSVIGCINLIIAALGKHGKHFVTLSSLGTLSDPNKRKLDP